MEELTEFVAGADLLIHDAMFTEEEYRKLEGWGHSTFSQALELANRAGVDGLHFFHHSPKRTDKELDHILRSFREEVAARGLGLELSAATEGVEHTFRGNPGSG
jgi:ribonuclease BN (tRNA processing enzyme)